MITPARLQTKLVFHQLLRQTFQAGFDKNHDSGPRCGLDIKIGKDILLKKRARPQSTTRQMSSVVLTCTSQVPHGHVTALSPFSRKMVLPCVQFTAICEPPCENHGTCVKPDVCRCPAGYEGNVCQHQQGAHVEESLFGDHLSPFMFKRQGFDNSTVTSGPDVDLLSLRQYATCSSWSRDHFRSFDERDFSFNGGCTYTMAAATDGTFDITIKNIDCSSLDTCYKRVEMVLGFDVIAVDGPDLYFNDIYIDSFPYLQDGITIKQIGDYKFLESNIVLAKWDGKMTFHLSVLSALSKGNVVGICGPYDDDPDNDLQMRDGAQATYASQFAMSWEAAGPGRYGFRFKLSLIRARYFAKKFCSAVNEEYPCQEYSSRAADAEALCQVIQDAADFQACHNTIFPAKYIDECKYDLCMFGGSSVDEYMEALCLSFEAYARECASKNVVLDWRSDSLCPKQCPDIMEYTECSSLCPATCLSYPTDAIHCPDECVQGCQCPEGTVEEEGVCITVEECPCLHNRQKYPTGSTTKVGCNLCMCEASQWICTNNICEATCEIIGDPHFITFDKKKYSFQGRCHYTLVEDYVGNTMQITGETLDCGSGGTVSCTHSINILVNTTEVTLLRNNEVSINGAQVEIPFENYFVSIRRATSTFIIVESFGLRVKWDGMDRLYITLTPFYMDKVRGLCGTYDGDQNNDFFTPSGDIETDKENFVQKFTLDPLCQETIIDYNLHPCDLNSQMNIYALEKCAIINSDIFRPCHGSSDPQVHYEICRYDVCGCQSDTVDHCLCNAISAYSNECANSGVFIDWHEHQLVYDVCEITCPPGQLYSQCGPTCGQTCRDLAYDCVEGDDCTDGCNCPEGLVLNDAGQCVLIMTCPCFYADQSYPIDTVIQLPCKECTCANGTFNCVDIEGDCDIEESCPNNLQFTYFATQCPITCENYHLFVADAVACTAEPQPGCVCQEGFALLVRHPLH
ncbi:SCO-spondin-like [Amphiura filiformis]|uniref:SCO-spondin-like n=1 Tax=Amphiura filiformis TaxID=82378 RepID=UPI003B210E91